MEMYTTKERIMGAAIVLFSDTGYDRVSMRDIAGMVGIKAASIYNHFPSKRDILKGIYDFYIKENRVIISSLETLLQQLETEPIQDLLMKLEFYHPPQIQNMMDRAFLIASQRICLDKESENFIREHFFDPLINAWSTLLNRAVELGKIEPLDTDIFARMLTYYALGVAKLNCTSMRQSMEQWRASLAMFISLLKPIPPA